MNMDLLLRGVSVEAGRVLWLSGTTESPTDSAGCVFSKYYLVVGR